MSRASGCLWLVVGLILALVAGGIAYITLQQATTAKTVSAPVELASVVVAVRQVEIGTVLGAGDMTTQSFPTTALPVGTISNTQQAVGLITMVPLNTGELLLQHHLIKPDITARNLGFTLPEGKVAIALTAEDLLSKGQLIGAGSRVDLLYSLPLPDTQGGSQAGGQAGGGGAAARQVTFGTLQGITVVSVLRSGGADVVGANTGTPLVGGGSDKGGVTALGTPYAYILALDSQDALVLKYLRDAGAIMDLALRNISDNTEHPADPVDLPYLIDKYQLQPR